MKDGRLNKCSLCVLKAVKEWRKENPEARSEEHAKVRNKKGFKTRQEYFALRKEKAKGRKAILLQYGNKRRMQKQRTHVTELDELVFIEAVDLREKRNKITGFNWHVDHIVPLNHKKACGLHNAFNLQVVPAFWNVKKSASNMDRFFISGY